MWNSPYKLNDAGKRYTLEDISGLLFSISNLLEFLKHDPPKEYVSEPNLQPLESDEFIYTLYQVIDALLSEEPLPEGGHTGIQEAMIAELLEHTYSTISCELDHAGFGDDGRQAAWKSIDRLLIKGARTLPSPLEHLKIDLTSEEPYLNENLTHEVWKELLLEEGGLWSEFLWDCDWRVGAILDMPNDQAEQLGNEMGLDLNTVHALPHTPSSAEVNMATHYCHYISWKLEVIDEAFA